MDRAGGQRAPETLGVGVVLLLRHLRHRGVGGAGRGGGGGEGSSITDGADGRGEVTRGDVLLKVTGHPHMLLLLLLLLQELAGVEGGWGVHQHVEERGERREETGEAGLL